jgi:pyruvoyl-dependent arginine decarboxylase
MEMCISNRVPYEYFLTSGKGESDVGSEGLPYETGSYDAALNDAGIENANLMMYTSVIPTGAKLISKKEGLKRIEWGQVIETIKAETNGRKGEFISAAVITTDVYKEGKYLGGFACEYSGRGSKKEALESLLQSIKEMIERRGMGKLKDIKAFEKNKTSNGFVIYPGKHYVYDCLHITKNAGTVFAALCFMSYNVKLYSNNKTKYNKTIKNKTIKNKTIKNKTIKNKTIKNKTIK